MGTIIGQLLYFSTMSLIMATVISVVIGICKGSGKRGPFYRSKTNKALSGVCGGLGEYLGVNATIIRLIFVLLLNNIGVLVYIIITLTTSSKE